MTYRITASSGCRFVSRVASGKSPEDALDKVEHEIAHELGEDYRIKSIRPYGGIADSDNLVEV